jgi:CBS domain-containing protein
MRSSAALRVRVRDIMSSPAVTVHADTTLEQAALSMLERRVGCLPVVDDEGKLVGILTESDFAGRRERIRFTSLCIPLLLGQFVVPGIQGLEEACAKVRANPVRSIMTTTVVTATEDEPATAVAFRMLDRDIHHIPVVRDGTPVGVITRHDLLRVMARQPRGGGSPEVST